MSTGTLFGLHMNTQQTCLHAKRKKKFPFLFT
jgi:hypothetical protein